MPADEGTTRRDLGHLFPQFHKAVTKGVRAYYADYAKSAHKHRINTRRDIMRDEIVDELRAALDSAASVRMIDHNQTTYAVLDERYQLKVKKSDESGGVQLAKTQASFAFQANEQPNLFGYEMTNLYLSYIPSFDDPLNPLVYLICPNLGGYEWAIEIDPPAAEIAGEITASPTPDDSDGVLVQVIEVAEDVDDTE